MDHIIATKPTDTLEDIQRLRNMPGVSGILHRVTWRELEPEIGRYDFSNITDIVREVDNVTLMIVDKSFDGANPMPDYMKVIRTSNGRMIGERWNPFYVTRFNNLIDALLDSGYPDSISFQESSVGEPLFISFEYTKSLIDTLVHASKSFDVYWPMNWMETEKNVAPDKSFHERSNDLLEIVINCVAGRRIKFGGPDLIPVNGPTATLREQHINLMQGPYSLYAKYPQLNWYCSAQFDSYCFPPEKILELAYQLNCKEIHWTNATYKKMTKHPGVDMYTIDDALKVIDQDSQTPFTGVNG